MKSSDIQEALDEFDARYLECYHQVTSKPGLVEWSSMNRLSSPLLSPQSEAVVSTSNPDASADKSVPRGQTEFEGSVTFTAMLLANASPTYLTLDSDNYRSVDLGSHSPNMQLRKPLFPPSQFGQYFDQPLVNEVLFTPLDDPLLESCSSIGGNAPFHKEPTLAHPLRMNRLHLTLMLTSKLSMRRSKERRSTITTYVGNPFYRRRNLQLAKPCDGLDAV